MLCAVLLLDVYFIKSRFQVMEQTLFSRAELLAKQVGASAEFALFSGNNDQL
jgi:hypothetical protein